MLAATCGQRIVAALPLLWAKWVSLHDATGRIHWSSGEDQGLGEHEAVRAALENFVGNASPARVNHPLLRGRTAVLLRASDELGQYLGFVMVVVEDRWLRSKGPAAPDLPVPVVRAVREWAATLASATSNGNCDLSSTQVNALLEPNQSASTAASGALQERLHAFAMELHAQYLTPIQPGSRIKRYEILMREAGAPESSGAPAALIKGAVRHGLSAQLDRRVITELLPWLEQRSTVWSGEPAQFSVNLAADSFREPQFMEFLTRSLQDSKLPRALLAFEVEYDFVCAHPEYVRQLAAQLEQVGAGLVIDNFTIGESSPEFLLLPGLRLVKIDPRVTERLIDERAAQARVVATAQMARIAGVHVVAKRIERPQEQALLQLLGVDFIQGFATGAPASLEGFDAAREQRMIVDPALDEQGSAFDAMAADAPLVATG